MGGLLVGSIETLQARFGMTTPHDGGHKILAERAANLYPDLNLDRGTFP